jgi:hypothetical protein
MDIRIPAASVIAVWYNLIIWCFVQNDFGKVLGVGVFSSALVDERE